MLENSHESTASPSRTGDSGNPPSVVRNAGSIPMKSLSLLCVAFPIVTSSLAAQKPGFDFTIKNIMRGPELYGREPQNVRWSADGKWIYFNWLEPGTDWREAPKQFRVRAVAGAKPERVSIREADASSSRYTDGELSHSGRYSVVAARGDLYINDLTNGATR